MKDYNNTEILIVEDNPHDAELFIRALKKKNLANNIYVAVNGEEAHSFIFSKGEFVNRRNSKSLKVVFLDLKLPKISGLQVLKEIKNNQGTAQTPVVVVSSSAEYTDIKKAYDLGANGYVVKPLDFNDFQTTMSAAGFYWIGVNEPPM